MFQYLLKQRNVTKEDPDLFHQLQSIVSRLLMREIPSQTSMHQIILNANIKIQELSHISSCHHRKHMNLNTSIGLYHKKAYEITSKQLNQLQHLLDCYIILHIEDEREHINHRLKFHNQTIETLYREMMDFKKYASSFQTDEMFWNALKEDILPILAELR